MQENKKFSNQVVLPENLQKVEDQDFEALEEKYKRLKHISFALTLTLVIVLAFLVLILSPKDFPFILYVGIIVFLLLIYIWRYIMVTLAFPKKGYLLREHDVSYRSGLLFYKLTSIPFNRIQHVEVSQNIIEKSIGLSKVKIYTAGGSVSDLSIPGLLPERANQVESFLLSKASQYE